MDDMTLQARVMDELVWVPNVDTAHIGVTARNGVVTLSGIVSTLAEKLAAERAVRRVKGVRGIAEEIIVRPANAHKQADEEIAERAVKILAWDVEVPGPQIQVKVEKGVVTLTGFVTYQFQKQAAENDIRRLGGVTGIVNLIELRAAGVSPAQSEGVHEMIEEALRRSAELEALQIRVEVAGPKVTLEGKVKSWWERSVAENAAWSAPGVTQVDNRLAIGT
ncbi:ornithine aminotransferase [Rhodopila globiformis]|uniref:Ornithine aminotransferase n=1 Tax=Rhodopila globiformis TaxID=1071 RepID=A0A2S6N391_RHOGL|nr:ornithine aminotransferase [Rhodopila globiformis]